VATALGGVAKNVDSGSGPRPMALDAFIAETMTALAGGADEVAIANARNLVNASGLEMVKKVFTGMNG
jgi:hypothetical protein